MLRRKKKQNNRIESLNCFYHALNLALIMTMVVKVPRSVGRLMMVSAAHCSCGLVSQFTRPGSELFSKAVVAFCSLARRAHKGAANWELGTGIGRLLCSSRW